VLEALGGLTDYKRFLIIKNLDSEEDSHRNKLSCVVTENLCVWRQQKPQTRDKCRSADTTPPDSLSINAAYLVVVDCE
jgi:hypothetical protein